MTESNKAGSQSILDWMNAQYKVLRAKPPTNRVVLVAVLALMVLIGSIKQSCQGTRRSQVYDPQAIHERVVAQAQAKKKQEAAEAAAAAASDSARAAEAKQEAEKREADRKAIVEEYRAMTAPQRLSAVTISLCS